MAYKQDNNLNSFSASTVSATTLYSGSTDISDLFAPISSIHNKTYVQNGINTFTGGTENNPTINVTGLSIDNISVSGESSFQELSATTIYSGGTDVSDLFISVNDQTTASNGLTKLGNDIKLGGDLTETVTFINGFGNKSLVLNNLQIFQLFTSGVTNFGSLTLDSSVGSLRSKNVSVTNTNSKGLTVGSTNSVNLSADGLNLSSGSGNTVMASNVDIFLQAGDGDGRGAKYIAVPTILDDKTIPSWKNVQEEITGQTTTALNGLNKVGNDVKLGGSLTEPTTITGGGGGIDLTLDMTAGNLNLKGTNIYVSNYGSTGARYLTSLFTNQLDDLSIPSWVNVKEQIGAVDSTGVLKGGVISNGTSVGTYSISNGTGQTVTNEGVKTPVLWNGKTDITPVNIATNNRTFLAIDSNGNVVEQVNEFTLAQSRSLIVLGQITHTDGVNISFINNCQHIAYNAINSVYDLADSIGIFNVSGNKFFPNAGANLSIDKTVGNIFKAGSNYLMDVNNPHEKVLPLINTVSFTYVFNDDSTTTPVTVIDPANLDDGAGGLTNISNNNKWSVQRIYLFPTNDIVIQRGVKQFNSQTEAVNGISGSDYFTAPSLLPGGLLRGWLVIKKNASDLTNPSQAQFIEAPKFGEGGGANGGSVASVDLQTAYNNSINTEILTDASRGALSVKQGSGLDTDFVFEGINGAGLATFGVRANGKVEALDFNGVAITTAGDAEDFLSANGTYIDPATLSPYELNFEASKDAPLSLALSIYGDATIIGTENKASQVSGVTYYGSTNGGDTFALVGATGDFTDLTTWVGTNSGPATFLYLKAAMVTTSTQLQVVNITYKKS